MAARGERFDGIRGGGHPEGAGRDGARANLGGAGRGQQFAG